LLSKLSVCNVDGLKQAAMHEYKLWDSDSSDLIESCGENKYNCIGLCKSSMTLLSMSLESEGDPDFVRGIYLNYMKLFSNSNVSLYPWEVSRNKAKIITDQEEIARLALNNQSTTAGNTTNTPTTTTTTPKSSNTAASTTTTKVRRLIDRNSARKADVGYLIKKDKRKLQTAESANNLQKNMDATRKSLLESTIKFADNGYRVTMFNNSQRLRAINIIDIWDEDSADNINKSQSNVNLFKVSFGLILFIATFTFF